LHNELADPARPAQYVPFGRPRKTSQGSVVTLGGEGSPVSGGVATFVVDGMGLNDSALLLVGASQQNVAVPGVGIALVVPRFTLPVVAGHATIVLPASYADTTIYAQALMHNSVTNENSFSNAVRVLVRPQGFGQNKLGYRAGHPSRVLFNAAGNRALLLNRGSEDLFLYKVTGNNLELMTVFPPRLDFAPRAALDLTTPMGDLPLGMAMVPDATTPNNDDAALYVVNEVTRTLSVLRVDFLAGTIQKTKEQIPTHLGADAMTLSQRVGEELFEDASRPQTAGNFNNSCSSCHFEGGDDGNVWQRRQRSAQHDAHVRRHARHRHDPVEGRAPEQRRDRADVRRRERRHGRVHRRRAAGPGGLPRHPAHPAQPQPRSDHRPVQRHGGLRQGPVLRDQHDRPQPDRSPGRLRGLPPRRRDQPAAEPGPALLHGRLRQPVLSGGETLGTVDPDCFALKQNLLTSNLRNVNTACNVDADLDTFPTSTATSTGSTTARRTRS
jgi:hypothetical protein